MKVAIASSDGKFISRHFGNTSVFLIVEVDKGGWKVLGQRENTAACEEGSHDPARFNRTLNLISDCSAVIAAKIGGFAQNALNLRGIQALEKTGFIGEVLDAYIKYLGRKKSGFLKESKKKTEAANNNHPCFDNGAHGKFGRIHLPVAKRCNIKCRFCERSINEDELRPGVSAGILDHCQAVETVKNALKLCPELTVIGIAGPGDALSDDAALETFRYVHEKVPQLSLCLSTNGLGLYGKTKALYDAGVRYITITVNAVTPQTGVKIVDFIQFGGKTYRGEEAAKILIERQLQGIQEAFGLGFQIKINTVLVPGVNDHEVGEIARITASLGANRHNIMPLIPCADMKDIKAPTCMELEVARIKAEKYLPVFRHCAHCRADACGIPGVSDVSKKLYENTTKFRCNNVCG